MPDHLLHQLRGNPTEWHRRGMTSPAEIDALVADRIGQHYAVTQSSAADPSYADFFVCTAAVSAVAA